ncbi:hypothetical protein K2X30_14380 [bacterium]|nr:hypothetical protein [bacterium]
MNAQHVQPVKVAMITTAILTLVPIDSHAARSSRDFELSPSVSLAQVIFGAAMTLAGSTIVLAGDTIGGGLLKHLFTDRLGSQMIQSGLEMLDREKSIAFAAIENWEEANSLGLSEQEVRAYNSELKNIRWLQNRIADDVRGSFKSGPWDERVAVDRARQRWMYAVDQRMISSEAFAAVQKISFSLYSKAKPAA